MGIFSSFFGDHSSRTIKEIEPLVKRVNSFEQDLIALDDKGLLLRSANLRDRAQSGENLDDILPEAFALVREASRRTSNQRHYDVQIIGGIVLHRRGIAEMKTGEGKTLVATLPAYLNALSGKGVHVVTVNDYLARRDATWMGQIYKALGLSVSVINHDASFIYDESSVSKKDDQERDELGSFKVEHEFLRPCTRIEAYEADITYGTNSEFGFDYLRDNLQYSPTRVAQKMHHYAIVDEVDSILIDEARTPLIISAPVADSEKLYETMNRIVARLDEGVDYTVDEKLKAIQVTESGIDKTEEALGVKDIYTEKGIKYVHHLETAIRARALYKKEKDYVVRDNEVVIVDQSTGRLQPGRRWSEGLHQAIEAKEGVKIQEESRTFASITYQNFFRMYDKLSGMTGTASTSAEEFRKVYNLDTITIPTNRPIARIDHNDLIFQTEKGKFKAIVKKVKELNQKGQPVLVGTASIEKNELLSEYFNREGVKHVVLNAKIHEQEGEIIARGGRRGAVTVATNMAGRGVDIKLGGESATKEEYEEVKSLGGLFVLGTERHEARRIDNQLRGRAGRQGDPGETQFYVSLEDSLMRIFASDTIKNLMGKFNIPEDEPIESRMVTRSLESAQSKVEGFHFDARKHVLEYDDVLNQQRTAIYGRRRVLLFSPNSEILEQVNSLVMGDEKLESVIKEKIATIGEDQFLLGVRQMMLQVIDMFWVDHLEQMDYMRNSVRLRAYGQRDPLVEYKREGLRLYKELQIAMEDMMKRLIINVGNIAPAQTQSNLREIKNSADKISNQQNSVVSVGGDKIGRNDPCPCGSGKKWKNCGLINSPQHKI